MFNKLWRSVKEFFTPPRLEDVQPALHDRGPSDMTHTSKHETNVENISLSELRLQRDALQKNLIIMHRTMLIALLAVLVSIALGIYAVTSKPNVKVKVYEQKTIQTSN
ncbi:hypothetical protein A3A68_00350 [Candidatus Saccharibacteria bacterium RIFCSPLOWO2_01_FULL_48_13]|nr:MAG: hypothetical protein A3F38_02720 [Candidatus Saccharibacteria bacterium RIFCSPHIGHO2_12_FULL_48_21]OGL36686.1 MAG: hypothetical protein A3A68_00350 [Candidatus Saccharibacteria bacterium RIFCSPLOWO2_01_FULL_48_13]